MKVTKWSKNVLLRMSIPKLRKAIFPSYTVLFRIFDPLIQCWTFQWHLEERHQEGILYICWRCWFGVGAFLFRSKFQKWSLWSPDRQEMKGWQHLFSLIRKGRWGIDSWAAVRGLQITWIRLEFGYSFGNLEDLQSSSFLWVTHASVQFSSFTHKVVRFSISNALQPSVIRDCINRQWEADGFDWAWLHTVALMAVSLKSYSESMLW